MLLPSAARDQTPALRQKVTPLPSLDTNHNMSSPSSSHMPALKVGGRRLSVGNKLRRSSVSKETAKPAEPATPPDYPRPKEEEGVEHDEQAQHQQEEQAKREKNKRAEFSPEHVVKRDSKWTDGAPRKNQAHGGAGRISQPAGKAFPS